MNKSITLFSILYFLFAISISQAQLVFVDNQGQIHDQHGFARPDVLFSAQGSGLTFHFTKNSMAYQIDKFEGDTTHVYRLDLTWLYTNKEVEVESREKSESYNNYYIPNKELTHVELSERLYYNGIYENIDLTFYDNDGQLEYDFIVNPKGDPNDILWEIRGATNIEIDENGNLIIECPFGVIQEEKPIAFCDGKEVEVQWKINEDVLSFDVGDFDRNKTLRIDPKVGLVDWSTYYGGSGFDLSYDISIDASGDVYSCGMTQSSASIATTGAHQTTIAGARDGFISKFNSSGTRLWATYYGGTSNDEIYSCATKGSSDLYVVGYSYSTTGIATSGSHQDTFGGVNDGFIAKFNSSGVRSWASYYGGSQSDFFTAVCIGDSNFIYAVGNTLSNDSIATPGSHDDSINGGSDGFLVKFTDAGSRIWGTYIGGSFIDYMNSCDAFGSSIVMVSGYTESSTGIGTAGTHQSAKAGFADGFIMKFDGSGSRLWGTYFGGVNEDVSNASAMDADGNVYLVGYTRSFSGISTTGAFQTSYGGGSDDGYIAKFNTNGLRDWSTYYGGTSADVLTGVSLNGQTEIFVYGNTSSTSNISTPGGHQDNHGGNIDAFLVKMDSSGSRQWSTYYGGSAIENSSRCKSSGNGIVYINGQTASTSSISTTGGHQTSLGGSYDGFLAKFYEACSLDSTSISDTSCNSYTSPSGKYIWTMSGQYTDTLVNSIGCDSVLYIDLTIITQINNSVDLSACNDSIFVSPSGKYTWTSPGNYYDTLQSSQGCDSILEIDLSFVTIDTSFYVLGDSLYSGEADADSYTWEWCPPNFVGPLGRKRYIKAPQLVKGFGHRVLIEKDGCSVYTGCFLYTGIENFNDLRAKVEIFPNPNQGSFIIKLDQITSPSTFEIFSEEGKMVYSRVNFMGSRQEINLSSGPGLYFLRISNAHGVINKKFIVE